MAELMAERRDGEHDGRRSSDAAGRYPVPVPAVPTVDARQQARRRGLASSGHRRAQAALKFIHSVSSSGELRLDPARGGARRQY